MDDMNKLFPAGPEAVPAAYRLPDLVEQREYLVAGELRNWNGPFENGKDFRSRRHRVGKRLRKLQCA